MPVRIALVAACVAAVVFGATRLHRSDECESARTAINTALFRHREPSGGLAHQQRRLLDNCRDGSVLAFVSTVETTAGQRGFATALARRVTRDEPSNRVGWVALAQALQRSDPRGSAAAAARAKALDPKGAVPRAAGAGAARRGA
jgi:Flp pilus assembly protein TadD